jgi:branched-chain amino acid transport system permease protein
VTRFLQQVVDGLASGSIYAAMALGLVLIYRSTNVLNFAQGEMAMFSTYVAWQFTAWGVPVALAILLAIGLSFVGGMAIQQTVVRHVDHDNHLAVVVVTLGLFLVLNAGAGWIWTYFIKDFPSPFPPSVWSLGEVRLSLRSVLTLAVVGAQMVLLWFLFQRTKVGLAMRAAALYPGYAGHVGISAQKMMMLGWGLSAALGALGGALIAPKLFLEPNMMFAVLLYAFAGAALGGLDSALGAVLGGLIVGVSENLAGSYIDWVGSDLKILVPFALILAVLFVKPTGLFGRPTAGRV